jgi:hypothetical protein
MIASCSTYRKTEHQLRVPRTHYNPIDPMKHSRFLPLALLLLAPCLPGQKAFESLLPGKPFMELRIRDSKNLFADLKDSRIGQVVTDASLREIGDVVTKMPEWKSMLVEIEQANKKSKGVMASMGRMFLESPAEIRIAVGVHRFEEEFDGWMVFRISGDQEVLADFVSSAAEEAWLGSNPKVVGKVEFLGEERIFYRTESDIEVVIPFIHDGAAYLVASSDHEKDYGKKQAQGVESMLRESPQRFAVGIDVGAIMPMLLEKMREDVPEEDEELFNAIGFDGLGRIGAAMDVKGDRVHLDLTIDVPQKGLIGDLMRTFVAREGRAVELLRWFPQGVQMADLWGVNLAEGYRLIMDFAAKAMESQGMEGMDPEEMFEQRFGVGLRKGLIEPLDGRILRFQSLDSQGMADIADSEVGSSTQCVCLGLKDAAVFGKTVDTIIRKMAWHVSRKKEVYRGVDLYYFKALGLFEIHYGLTDQFFLLAFGAKPASMIRKVVDQEKALAAGEKGFIPGKDLKEQLGKLPPNVAGLSVADMVSMMTTLSDAFNQIVGLGGYDDEDEEDGPMINAFRLLGDKVPALLRKHEIRTAVTSFSRDKKTIRMLTIY